MPAVRTFQDDGTTDFSETQAFALHRSEQSSVGYELSDDVTIVSGRDDGRELGRSTDCHRSWKMDEGAEMTAEFSSTAEPQPVPKTANVHTSLRKRRKLPSVYVCLTRRMPPRMPASCPSNSVTIKGQVLEPTVVFDTFWRFVAERKAIDDRRRSGQPAP